jgi:hypothetical protein
VRAPIGAVLGAICAGGAPAQDSRR